MQLCGVSGASSRLEHMLVMDPKGANLSAKRFSGTSGNLL